MPKITVVAVAIVCLPQANILKVLGVSLCRRILLGYGVKARQSQVECYHLYFVTLESQLRILCHTYNVQKCEIFVENFSNRHFAAHVKLRKITIKNSSKAILERNMKQSKCIENQDALSSFIHFNMSKYILYKTVIFKIYINLT